MAISHIERLGFKKIEGMDNSFYARIKNTTLFEPFSVILTVMPISQTYDEFLFTATYNGNTAFSGRREKLYDLGLLLKSYACYEDILIFAAGKAELGLKKASEETNDL